MADGRDQEAGIPPIRLDPADVHILRFLRERGPTYHINISKAFPHDISYVSRRCKYLTSHDLLERRSRTYYALTEQGEEFITETAAGGTTEQAAGGG